jgi:hypothetical protein
MSAPNVVPSPNDNGSLAPAVHHTRDDLSHGAAEALTGTTDSQHRIKIQIFSRKSPILSSDIDLEFQ